MSGADRLRQLVKQATPGPWHWTDTGENKVWGGHLEPAVAEGAGYDGLWTDICISEADARLIALAPDLAAWAAWAAEGLARLIDVLGEVDIDIVETLLARLDALTEERLG